MEYTMPETENSLLPRGVEIDISSEVYRLYRFPKGESVMIKKPATCLLYTSPSPRDGLLSRMPSSA